MTRRAHAAYFLDLAEEAEPHLVSDDQLMWFDRLETEFDNLRAALEWFRGNSQPLEGLRLVAALFWFWWTYRGREREGPAWMRVLLEAARAATLPVPAKILVLAGQLLTRHGQPIPGRELIEQGLAAARAAGDDGTVGLALYWLGVTLHILGEDDAARPTAEDALAANRRAGEPHGIAHSHQLLGWIAFRRGDLAAARAHLDEAVARARAIGDRWSTAFALEVLGDVACAEATYGEAHALWQESLARYIEIDDKGGIVSLSSLLGKLALLQGEHALAYSRYSATVQMSHKLGHFYWLCGALDGLATVAAAQRRFEHALRVAGASAAHRESRASDMPGSPEERLRLDRALEAAHQALGDEAAAAAWSGGQVLTLEQAIAEALRDDVGA